MTPKEILAYWEEQGWFDQLSRGAHLILTGGEPMLYQLPLVPLLQLLKERLFLPYIEVETNATILPVQPFDAYISQYNCSPKLTSAGNPPEKAYVPHVLRYFADDPGGIRANFKFVIQDPDRDVEEIITRYLEPFSIPRRRVWLMPEGATRARQIEMSERVAEVALKHGFNFSPRLQLLIWDRATGR
jgi:7-carboxy-7-deazaguanine synthase